MGTDGNRNFDLGFGGSKQKYSNKLAFFTVKLSFLRILAGSSDQPCSQTFKGTAAFSEPETAAIDAFVRPISDEFVLALTIHSYGQFFVYPWGFTTDEDPDNINDLVSY